jgi:methionyl-tRNA formyltransferase
VILRVLDDVVLFGADTARSRAYLSFLLDAGLRPAACVVLSPPDAPRRAAPAATDLFDNLTPLAEAARKAGVEVVEIAAGDVNAPQAVAALAALSQRVVVFSGPPGALVKAPLFAIGKTFLHAHPGRLPRYRGSTTMYYSLLAEGRIWVSAMILAPEIDRGPVVDVMEADLPEDPAMLDHVFDPVIRARLMVRVLQRYLETGAIEGRPQRETADPAYFVIHPVLKHIALLSRPWGGPGDIPARCPGIGAADSSE